MGLVRNKPHSVVTDSCPGLSYKTAFSDEPRCFVLADDGKRCLKRTSAASKENDPSGAGGATGAVISSDRHGDGFPVVLANRCPMQSFLTGRPYSRSGKSPQ